MKKPRWSMTEEKFLRLKEAMENPDVYNSDNCYCGVAIGSLLFEFCTGDREDGIDLYVNVFEAGVDTGYGYLEDDTPYDNIDCWANDDMFDFNVSYEEFKRNVIEFIKKDAEECKYSEKLDADMEPNWYGFKLKNKVPTKEDFIRRYKNAILTYFSYKGDSEGQIIRRYIMGEYSKILNEMFGMDIEEIDKLYDDVYWSYYGGKRA